MWRIWSVTPIILHHTFSIYTYVVLSAQKQRNVHGKSENSPHRHLYMWLSGSHGTNVYKEDMETYADPRERIYTQKYRISSVDNDPNPNPASISPYSMKYMYMHELYLGRERRSCVQTIKRGCCTDCFELDFQTAIVVLRTLCSWCLLEADWWAPG